MPSQLPAEFEAAQLREDEAEIQEEESQAANLGYQALWVLIHCIMAVGAWALMMVLITFAKPDSLPVFITLALSFIVPFIVGNIFTRIKQNDMAPYTWLVGLIWFLIICLWILDMPTGPNQCYHCDASEKIFKSFFSFTEDSNLVDGQTRFIGTWPATALIAYGIGARFALKQKK
jgi:hypothetical protein